MSYRYKPISHDRNLKNKIREFEHSFTLPFVKYYIYELFYSILYLVRLDLFRELKKMLHDHYNEEKLLRSLFEGSYKDMLNTLRSRHALIR